MHHWWYLHISTFTNIFLTTLDDPDLLTAKMSVTYSCRACEHVFANIITGLLATYENTNALAVGVCQLLDSYAEASLSAQHLRFFPTSVLQGVTDLKMKLQIWKEEWTWTFHSPIGSRKNIENLKSGFTTDWGWRTSEVVPAKFVLWYRNCSEYKVIWFLLNLCMLSLMTYNLQIHFLLASRYPFQAKFVGIARPEQRECKIGFLIGLALIRFKTN